MQEELIEGGRRYEKKHKYLDIFSSYVINNLLWHI